MATLRPVNQLEDALLQGLDPAAREWFETARAAEPQKIPVLLPQLPRRLGRDPLSLGRISDLGAEGSDVDFAAWRRCDAGAAILLHGGQPPVEGPMLLDLLAHGDHEERAMVLRSAAVGRLDATTTAALFGEAQRTNNQDHLECLALDSDLAPRAVAAGALPRDDFDRLILKIAFIGLPAARMFGIESQASTGLSRMLQDLATEREAAGREVWVDTDWLIGHAPTLGTYPRLFGGLEHGADGRRLSAARGLGAALRIEPGFDLARSFLDARLPRERHPQVRAAIQQALQLSP